MRCLVAISGGMDSLACARLLLEAGYEIVPVHFVTGYEIESPREKIKGIEKALGLSVHLVDFSDAFRKIVINPFIKEYASGRTPNPCLVCNPGIKFGLLFDLLKDFRCDVLATGHYARILSLPTGGYGLFKGIDGKKDQSYFLSGISREKLGKILFPLGDWTKEELRKKMLNENLFPEDEKESQDICFLPRESYGDFLEREGNILAKPGPIVRRDGTSVGIHKGLHRYTIGQRKGLDAPGPAPYYVLCQEPLDNTLVVGFKEETFANGCEVTNINWLAPPPGKEFQASVKIRYRHKGVDSLIQPEGTNRTRIFFSEPQSAVTPGQGAVLYNGDQVLGGGIIQKAIAL